MANIDQYTSRVAPQGGVNAQASPVDFGYSVAQAIGNVAEGVGAVGKAMYEEETTKEVMSAYRMASEKQLQWDQEMTARSAQAQPGDTTFMPRLVDDMRKDFEKAAQTFTNRKAQEVFTKRGLEITTSLGGQAINIQAKLVGEGALADSEQRFRVNEKRVNADPTQYDRVVGEVERELNDPDTLAGKAPVVLRQKILAAEKNRYAVAASEGYIGQDLYRAAAKLLPQQTATAYTTAQQPATSTFDRAVATVLKLEGGYADKDGASGAPVNFGINQKYNPDVDVKTLTREGAVKIYKERYWNAIKGDNLDPKIALMAFDTAVNMGPAVADRLLQQSGGDLATFVALRKERYQQIAQNPAQAKYLDGWLARTDKVAAASADVPTVDSRGVPIPQLKINKDTSLNPPQGVDIPGWNDLTLDQQQRLMAKVVTDFNSRVTVDRALLNDDRKNMHANYLAGNDYSDAKGVQARYVAAFGPEMASRMIAEDNNARTTGLFTKAIRGQSDVQQMEMLGAPPGANASKDEYDNYQARVQAVQRDRQELLKSPVDYVGMYSPAVRDSLNRLNAVKAEAQRAPGPDTQANVAKATQQYISASLSEQRRLGIAEPQILSKAQEDQLASQIENLAVSGRDVAQGVQSLYAQYGDYGPTVAAQMAKRTGGLMNVLGSGIDQTTAALLVEAHRNKAELKKTLSDDKTKNLDDTVRDTMRDYAHSLEGVPNGMNVLSNYQEQVSALAMLRMSKFGENQKEAVKKAYDSLVTSQYTFQDGYRVPVGLDAKVIARQAQRTVQTLSGDQVSLLPSAGVGNPEDRMAAQLAAIRSSGRWVTVSQPGRDGKQEEGLALMVPTPGGYSPVPDRFGKPLFKSFAEMLLEEAGAPVRTSQDALAQRDMRAYDRLKTQEKVEQRRLEEQRVQDMVRAFREGRK